MVCDKVLCRSAGELAKLPEGFRVEYGDIGEHWRVEEDYSVQHAYITHVPTRKMQYWGPLFEKEVACLMWCAQSGDVLIWFCLRASWREVEMKLIS
eukprot:10437240-Lingulodinium_polyedra.AAC.1